MEKIKSLGVISVFVVALFFGTLPMITADGAVSWSNPDMGYGGSAVSWSNPDMGYGGSAVSWSNPDMGYGGSAVSWMNCVEIVCYIYGQEYYTKYNHLENNMYGSPDGIVDIPIYDVDGNEINCHPQELTKEKRFVDVGINDKIVYGRIDFYWKSTKENVDTGEIYERDIYSGCAYFAYIIESPYRGIFIPVPL